ncbi:HD domain-containing protein, partial [Gordonibacter pamelaeae]|nr:HD domain-containing protein [Gordonibacter pamelaeae]
IDLNNADNDLAQEYLSCIFDLLPLDDVQDLKAITQHMDTSRFQHSLNVSYYTFLIARRLHLDSCSAARAGLLHDLYHYDWRDLDKDERPI